MSWTDAASVPPPPPTPGDMLRKAPKWVQVLMFILAGVWMIMVGAMLASGSLNLLGFVVQLPILTLLTVPLARRIARQDRDPEMVWFVMAAFSAKMLGGLIRYYFTYIAYVSAGDAEEYDAFGKYLAPFYRSLNFSPPHQTGPIPGTGFLETVTGILYSVTGSSKLGAFTVFAWLGFIGLLLCWRAFCRAVPNGDHQRYGMLVLFLPSLLYWSSALGKDAWALFGLGLCAYGVSRCLTRKPLTGLAFLGAGLWAVVMIRPHVGLVVFAGLVLAALLYKPHKKSALNPIVRVITFGILFVMMLVLLAQTQQFLGVESLNQETVNTQLSNAEGRTSKEDVGSVFTPVRVNTPLDLPWATATVLFRPFPYEAHNAQSLATSFEAIFLIYLMVRGWRRLIAIPATARRAAYIAYCLGITFTFVYAFSSFSNFGILARQRCQVMPFFLALICLNEVKRRERVPIPTELDALAPEPEDPYARFPELAEGTQGLETGADTDSGSKAGQGSGDARRPDHG
jgi:hypothetical protein